MSKKVTEVEKQLKDAKDGITDISVVSTEKKSEKGDERMTSSFKELEEEVKDLSIFLGTIAYLKKMKEYKENPKQPFMTLEDFKEKIEEFKKQQIYQKKET